MANEEVSSRIEVLRFPLIVGVVFIHNYYTSVSLAQGAIGFTHNGFWANFVRDFVSQGVARVSVPLFFLISGYLFFLGKWSRSQYFDKLRRRVRTLLIPLLFWNGLTLAILAIAQSIPQTTKYLGGTAWPTIRTFTVLDYLNALIGITVKLPLCLQFWFIRDLIVLVILSPLFYFLFVRKLALPFLVLLFGLWCVGIWPILWPSIDATLFFALGTYLSLARKDVNYLDKAGPWIAILFLGSVTLRAWLPGTAFYTSKVLIIAGVPAVWWLTRLVLRSASLRSLLLWLSGASFFVFAAHEPLLTVLRKVAYQRFAPHSDAAILALYFLLPVFLITFLVALHTVLLKTMPSVLGFITGSASRPKRATAEEPAGLRTQRIA